jgi:hypothetical protein
MRGIIARAKLRWPPLPDNPDMPQIGAAFGAAVAGEAGDDVAAVSTLWDDMIWRSASRAVATAQEGFDQHAEGGGDHQPPQCEKEEGHARQTRSRTAPVKLPCSGQVEIPQWSR